MISLGKVKWIILNNMSSFVNDTALIFKKFGFTFEPISDSLFLSAITCSFSGLEIYGNVLGDVF